MRTEFLYKVVLRTFGHPRRFVIWLLLVLQLKFLLMGRFDESRIAVRRPGRTFDTFSGLTQTPIVRITLCNIRSSQIERILNFIHERWRV